MPENPKCEYINCNVPATLHLLGKDYCTIHYLAELNRTNPAMVKVIETKRIKGETDD